VLGSRLRSCDRPEVSGRLVRGFVLRERSEGGAEAATTDSGSRAVMVAAKRSVTRSAHWCPRSPGSGFAPTQGWYSRQSSITPVAGVGSGMWMMGCPQPPVAARRAQP